MCIRDSLWRIITNVGRTISRELAPAMTEALNTFADWYIINKDLIDLGIETFFRLVTVAAQNLNLILLALGAAAALKGLAMIASLLQLIKVRIIAATVAALILPALLGAAIVAFVALVEDTYGFFQGKESLLGTLIGDYPNYKNVLIEVGAAFAAIGATVVKLSLIHISEPTRPY